MLSVNLSADDLRPLIQSVVAETITTIQADEERLGEKLAFTEQEAARLLSLESHQLRDERRRGRIGASVIVGKRIRYQREDLLAYLARERSEKRI